MDSTKFSRSKSDPEYYVEDENDIYNRALDAKDWLDGASDNDLAEL